MESLTPLWLIRRLRQWEARRTPPTLVVLADAGSSAPRAKTSTQACRQFLFLAQIFPPFGVQPLAPGQ